MCRLFWAVVVVFGCAWLPSSLSFAPTCKAPTFRRSSNRARCVYGSVALRCMAQLPERNVLTMQVKIDNNSLRDVYLVGTMHYNPVSLQRVGDTVDALAETNSLSSVVIESCAARYAKWKDASPTSMQRRFLLSEMQVASDRAKVAGVRPSATLSMSCTCLQIVFTSKHTCTRTHARTRARTHTHTHIHTPSHAHQCTSAYTHCPSTQRLFPLIKT